MIERYRPAEIRALIPVSILIIASVCMCGCVSTREVDTIEAPRTELKYSFSIKIPVVRPSQRDTTVLTSEAIELARNHRRGNVSVYIDLDSVPRLGGYALTDRGWMKHLRRRMTWYVEGWNFDRGTMAHVYLRRGGVGADYLGRVVFMKGAKELGFRAIGGNGNLPDYYRDMAKLGIYIP